MGNDNTGACDGCRSTQSKCHVAEVTISLNLDTVCPCSICIVKTTCNNGCPDYLKLSSWLASLNSNKKVKYRGEQNENS